MALWRNLFRHFLRFFQDTIFLACLFSFSSLLTELRVLVTMTRETELFDLYLWTPANCLTTTFASQLYHNSRPCWYCCVGGWVLWILKGQSISCLSDFVGVSRRRRRWRDGEKGLNMSQSSQWKKERKKKEEEGMNFANLKNVVSDHDEKKCPSFIIYYY